MCKYCKKDASFNENRNNSYEKGLTINSFSSIFGYSIKIENNISYMSSSDYHYSIVRDMDIEPKSKKNITFQPITYCPFCGKKLSKIDKTYYLNINLCGDTLLSLSISHDDKILKQKFKYNNFSETTKNLLILKVPTKNIVELYKKYFMKIQFLEQAFIKFRNINNFINELNILFSAKVVVDNRKLLIEDISYIEGHATNNKI